MINKPTGRGRHVSARLTPYLYLSRVGFQSDPLLLLFQHICCGIDERVGWGDTERPKRKKDGKKKRRKKKEEARMPHKADPSRSSRAYDKRTLVGSSILW